MKGQYRLLTEIFLFLLGIIIAAFTLTTFTNIQTVSEEFALVDQLTGVSNIVINGIIKAAEDESIVRIEVPEKISGKVYSIHLDDITDTVYVRTLEQPNIEISRQLFNISKSHDIIGEIVSTARFIEIINDGKNIQMKRGSF